MSRLSSLCASLIIILSLNYISPAAANVCKDEIPGGYDLRLGGSELCRGGNMGKNAVREVDAYVWGGLKGDYCTEPQKVSKASD
jgi:hypothetical protein